RVEVLEPGRAAEGAAARAAAVEALGLVAHPDLAQLDPAPEAGGEVLDELAEVDPMLGREVEGDPVAGERHLDLGQVHLEVAGLDPLATMLERGRLEHAIVVVLVEVLLLGLADDLARHVARTLELDEQGILEEDGAQRFAALGLDDDLVAKLEPEIAGV